MTIATVAHTSGARPAALEVSRPDDVEYCQPRTGACLDTGACDGTRRRSGGKIPARTRNSRVSHRSSLQTGSTGRSKKWQRVIGCGRTSALEVRVVVLQPDVAVRMVFISLEPWT